MTDEICLTRSGFRSSRFGVFSARAAQALAAEFDAMGVMDEAIQDRVGVGGVANNLMPSYHGELRGDDRRSASIALFEDFEQIVASAGVERFEAEVVEDQEIGAAR